MASYVVAVDFGGTHLRAALVDETGQIVQRLKHKTDAHLGPAVVIDRLAEAVQRIAEADGKPVPVQGVGVIAPGPLDPYQGIVFQAPNLAGWENIPLAAELQARVQRPVSIGNDANLAALAEQRYGLGQGLSDLIYLTISTGIGGGIICNHTLLLGAKGLAGEVGHMQIIPEGPLCGCGNRGCVEALASGPNIARAAVERIEHGLASSLKEVSHPITAEDVVAAARQGDKIALEVLERAGGFIGMAVANLIHLFNPQRVIIGGGVSNAGPLLFDPIRETTRRRLMAIYRDTFDIVPSQLGDDVGLLGAAALAFATSAP